ncbi:MAG: phosphohistidine phosphatase SixA [Cyanobium sp.]
MVDDPTTHPVPAPELLLLRHGIAEERSPDADDAARALTARGRERSRAVLERLAGLGFRADRLLSSPLRRARQTAELAVRAGLAEALELAEALAPAADPLGCLPQWLASLAPPEGERPRLLLVGHEPDLGLLACRLIGAPAGAIELRKAGLVVLRLSSFPQEPLAGSAQLQLLLSPRLLLS